MKTSPFQIGVIIFFVVCVALAMLIFTGVIGKDKNQNQSSAGSVVLWGTYPQNVIGKMISDYNTSHPKSTSISYVPIQSGALESQLAEAIASGTGPDLIMIGQDQIIRNQSKLYTIPYESLSEATFRATYAIEGELFMLPNGVIGLPVTIDPLIMYYNRDLLEGAGITIAPKTWNEVSTITPLLTKKDTNNNIIQSSVPFGIYSNLNNASDIVSLLILQAGNPIVLKQNDKFRAVLGVSLTQTGGSQEVLPAQAVVNFFTQFVDPTKETYTWNRSFTNARNQFISGELAMYIGYASELPSIVAQNPNLNFDVTKVPQPAVTGTQITYGNTQAVAIVKASRNIPGAIAVAAELSGQEFSSQLVASLLATAPVAPARRDLLGKAPQNVFGPVLYSSAIIARGWYSPGRTVIDPIFNNLIDDVVRGVSNVTQSVYTAHTKLVNIFGY